MSRIFLIGGSGILGFEVLRQLQLGDFEYLAPRSSDLDIRDVDAVDKYLKDFKPEWIINCAAWTNVDGAEEFFDEACALNVSAVKNIAEIARRMGSKVIHISTDYVFDGESSEPYDERSAVSPINKYGESKLKGEESLISALPTAYVVRTSWLYGASGKNFVKTIAGKALRKEPARVVNDQVGSPTSARDLAQGIISIVKVQPEPGIYNFSNEGSCSWFELAQAIYDKVGASSAMVEPISSASLAMAAKRPRFSLLSKEKWKSVGLSEVPNWESSLELLLPEIISKFQ